jgi:hypothetical protein
VVKQKGDRLVTRFSREQYVISVLGKVLTAIKLGPVYNRSFKDKLNDLDDTLAALDAHVNPIRDGLTAKINKGVQHLEEQMENLEQLQQASKTAIEKMMEVLADTNRTVKCKLRVADSTNPLLTFIRDARKRRTNSAPQASC